MDSPSSYQITVFAKGDLHVQWHRPHRHKPIRQGGLALRAWYGTSLCRQAKILSGASSIRYR